MSQIRDYEVLFAAGVPAVSTLSVKGNMFYVKKIVSKPAYNFTTYPHLDGNVLFEFDDHGKIVMRPREGGRRDYEKCVLSLINELGEVITPVSDIRLTVILGDGEIFSQRDGGAVPTVMVTETYTVTTGTTMNIDLQTFTGFYATPKEVRLNIPSTEPAGMFFSGGNLSDVEAWLEKGTVEWLDFAGLLYLRNTSGSTVNINVTVLYERD